MRLPKGEFGKGVLRRPGYIRSLVNRPDGIAQRGPWRVKRPKVEDAARVDAIELYARARPVSGRSVPVFQRGSFVRFEHDRFVAGTRLAKIAGVDILLTPRQRVPGRSARIISAACPKCDEQFRYLYHDPVGPGPRCRRCAGLIYKSQARSRSARLGRRCLAAEKRKSWDRLKPVNLEWEYRFFKRLAMADECRKYHEEYQQSRAAIARARTERRERKERDREEHRAIRAAWQQYVDGLDSSRLKRAAYKYRLLLRRLAADGPPSGNMLQEVGRLESLLPDFPENVRCFELRSLSAINPASPPLPV